MRRGTIFIILFVLVAVGVVAASQFLRTQPPLEIRVAVSPVAEAWVTDVVAGLNATNPLVNTTRRVHFTVETVDDAQVWINDNRVWTPENHPQAWIPAVSASVEYAAENRLPFRIVQPSTARTILLWGGFASIVDEIGSDGQFGWQQVAEAAPQRRLALHNPVRTFSGLAALLSGAADYYGTTAPSGGQINAREFRNWIQPVIEAVPNFNTLGGSAAATMASRGASVGEIALLPESGWLTNLRGQLVSAADPIRLSYPTYSVVFDFPLTLWNDSAAPAGSDEAAAVEVLGRWLVGEPQQVNAQNFGLRPAQADPTAGLFTSGEAYGALLAPTFQGVELPSRSDLRQLVSWVGTFVR